MSFNKNDESGFSDVVVLPRHFGLLNLPVVVRSFIVNTSLKRSQSFSSYFSFDVLEKLFTGNRSLFDRITYFLSLYGANFLTDKMPAFFPNDIHGMEQVLRFAGPRDLSIPPKTVEALGMKRFRLLAGGTLLYSNLDGMVVSRIQREASINLKELLKDNRFLIANERLYGSDDESVLPKNVFYARTNAVKVKSEAEKTTLKSEEKFFKDVVKSQVMNRDCGSSKEDEKPTAIEDHEIPQKTDDDVFIGDIAQKRLH